MTLRSFVISYYWELLTSSSWAALSVQSTPYLGIGLTAACAAPPASVAPPPVLSRRTPDMWAMSDGLSSARRRTLDADKRAVVETDGEARWDWVWDRVWVCVEELSVSLEEVVFTVGMSRLWCCLSTPQYRIYSTLHWRQLANSNKNDADYYNDNNILHELLVELGKQKVNLHGAKR